MTDTATAAVRYPELGCYLLAGQPKSPRDLIDEAMGAEDLGLGTAFISERYQSKEAATLCGAAGAVTQSIRIATAATNHNTRHPMVSAGHALTMHGLTGGRYVFGIGRGIEVMQRAYGIPLITTAQMESFVDRIRRGRLRRSSGYVPVLASRARRARRSANVPCGIRPEFTCPRRALL
jgi:alkanesulfonate monooxygenase SsuD/methylene tetrahydromethanopterin reductase-like flavin-dependent oxidoreductase (luciferase family)